MLSTRNEDVHGSQLLMQRRDTKNFYVDKDLDDVLSKIHKPNGTSRPGQGDSGRKTKMKINNRHSCGLKPQMESILSFVAEWVRRRAKIPAGKGRKPRLVNPS